MKQSGFGTIWVIAVALLVALGGAGWYVWHNKKTPAEPTPAANRSKQLNTSSPWEPPSSFTTYTNSAFGFSFAHPEDWGPVTPAPSSSLLSERGVQINNAQDGFEGVMTIQVDDPATFTIASQKYGPALRAVLSGDKVTWEVAGTGPVPEGYKAGDTYDIATKKSASGVVVYDLTHGDEGFVTPRWVFVAKGKLVTVAQPAIGPYYTTAPTQTQKANQQQTSDNIVKSIHSL